MFEASWVEGQAKAWKTIFDKINKDNPKDARPLSDWEYYAQQIDNISEVDGQTCGMEVAEVIAKKMAELV